jgi:hypothetical protein
LADVAAGALRTYVPKMNRVGTWRRQRLLSIVLAMVIVASGLLPHWAAAASPLAGMTVTVCGPDGLHTVTIASDQADTPRSGNTHDCTGNCTCTTCGYVSVARPTVSAEPVSWHPTPIGSATGRHRIPVSLGEARPPASRAPPCFL